MKGNFIADYLMKRNHFLSERADQDSPRCSVKSKWYRARVALSVTVVLWVVPFFIMSSQVLLGQQGRKSDSRKAGTGRFENSILDDEPFDLITLKDEEKNREFRVFPITSIPGRRVPSNPEPESELEIKFINYPDRLYRISWKDIGKLEFYEELLVSEANRLVAEKQFAPAFEHLSFLMSAYPATPGLEALRQKFLIASAQDMINSGRFAHALAVLEEFQRAYPNDPKGPQVRTRISNLANDMIEKFFNDGELVTAKKMVSRLERDYAKSPIPAVAAWKDKFTAYAETFRDKAIEYRDQGNFPDARVLAARMLEIEPEIANGREFLEELIRAYPLVRVGVFQQADRMDATELADWPVRRTGGLVSQGLFEFRSTGPEGGSYKMALGSFVHSDDRTELEMKIPNAEQPGVPTAYDLSQWMLRRSDVNNSEYKPSWSAIFKEVSVSGPELMTVRLKRPHVLPHAFLQWPLGDLGSEASQVGGLYARSDDRAGGARSFRWARDTKPADLQPVEVIEILYTDPKKALGDLVKGDLEVIDRLFPADASQLKGIREVKVESYALPMVHMLVPTSDHEFLADRDFRRTLLYAVNRQAILEGEILGGERSTTSRLISGPFPFGEGENDPLSYAYNKEISPLPYDPRLAKVLVKITELKLEQNAIKRKLPKPTIKPLRLGVPDYESARVAGQACIQQWKAAGIPAELVVLDSSTRPKRGDNSIDLLYVSAALWEPATDAERIFGSGGIAETDNIFVVQVLSNLRTARNWREVRQLCQDLHRLVNDHLPVLPLWQVSESFAYRASLQGIPKKPVALYPDIQRWRVNASLK
jgi:tetratricopeptide (TPR) repeat protein